MEKTAVEWLIDESMGLVIQYMNGTLNEDTLEDDIFRIGTTAKEMEKQRINDILDKLRDFDTWKEWKNDGVDIL
jgi:hypothetical protein